MRFLVLGSVNIDSIFTVEHIVREGETIQSLSFSQSAGGKGANQAAALGKAGADVSFAGIAGKDGLWVLSLLQGYGVDTGLSLVLEEGHTGQAIIQVDGKGENSIILNAGGNHMFTERFIDSVLDHFSSGDVLVLQNEVNLVPYAMMKGKERGMRICVNPSPFASTIAAWSLDLADFIFMNEIEAAGLSGYSSVPVSDAEYREVASTLSLSFPSSSVIVTAGESGSYHAVKGDVIHCPAFPVPAVDTTGAGDTFTGFFLAADSRGTKAEEALAIASRAASIAVSRKGAMESIPYLQELL